MSTFTYQTEKQETPLETFEWDNVWWEHTEDTTSKRILYIGDSISCDTRRPATRLSGDKMLFDGFGTSKALDNPFFKESLLCFIRQANKYNALIFNNGLHGWHLTDEEYEKHYRSMLEFLQKNSTAPIFVVLTTNINNDPERTEIIISRNNIAINLAKEFGFGVIDLFSVSQQYKDLHHEDGVHFNAAGSDRLAECILDTLSQSI